MYAAAVLIVSTVRGSSGVSSYFDLKESEEKLQATVEGLRDENKQLTLEIERIEKSDSYALKILRDRYHLVQDHERIIFFSDGGD